MNKERFITSFAALLVICLLVSGYAAMAAEYGSADDPLVTQSYIDEVLTPKAISAAQTAARDQASGYVSALDGKIDSVRSMLETRINQAVIALATDKDFANRIAEACGESAADWKSVTLSPGQSVYLAAGSKVVLREGSASCFESGGKGLIDLTNVKELRQGSTLTAGCLYETTVAAAGFITSDECRAMIYGSYNLG